MGIGPRLDGRHAAVVAARRASRTTSRTPRVRRAGARGCHRRAPACWLHAFPGQPTRSAPRAARARGSGASRASRRWRRSSSSTGRGARATRPLRARGAPRSSRSSNASTASSTPRAARARRAGRRRVSASTSTRLTLTDVSRNFGRRRALRDVSLHCRDAATSSGCSGHNGAGKSTLLAILATLLRPTHRRRAVRRRDRARTAAPPFARASACSGTICSSIPSSPPPRTCAFFARLYGLDRRRRAACDAALERAGLADRARRRRVGILARHAAAARARAGAAARAAAAAARRTVHRVSTRRRRRALVGAPARGSPRSGTIVVLATHDLDLAEGLLDARGDPQGRPRWRRSTTDGRSVRDALPRRCGARPAEPRRRDGPRSSASPGSSCGRT